MASHTPGPWKRGDCDSFIIWAGGYRSTSWTCGPKGPEAISIASIDAPWWARVPCSLEVREAWEAETKANACLIAAAPDMLEALHEAELQIVYLQEKFSVTGSGNTALAKIRRAISAAAPPAAPSP